ncbi:MAG: hypothetical protein HKN26_06365 [Acidimicrobiales bacterium]|nr:hypothetical protein [Acidimicrobiales bacterium]
MYEVSDSEWQWAQAEVRDAARAFGDQLRSLPDGSVRVPNLEWSASELARHIVSLPDLYRDHREMTEPFDRPESWPEYSRAARNHITETDPTALATLVEEAAEDILADADEGPNAPQNLYNQVTTGALVAASFLAELLLHGQDLGALTGRPPEIGDRQARFILIQQMMLTPAFLDPDKLSKCGGTYGIKIRGGGDYTYLVADRKMTVTEGRPDKADCRMSLDPVSFLLVSLGRQNQFKAALLGKAIAYGRKPWLTMRLAAAKVDGV